MYLLTVTPWLLVMAAVVSPAGALLVMESDPLPGGTVDPTTIPKYVIPLVIPPVMKDDGEPNSFEIEVREFRQQILPGGFWNTINGRDDDFHATKVWGHGPAAEPTPRVAPDPTSQFNYPSYTIETRAHSAVEVRWINGLVDERGRYLPHLLPIDQTLHWANPPAGPGGTDSVGTDPEHYEGPVPIVTHVHGAHVGPESDGYPEAWWLPDAVDIPAGYARHGRLFDDVTGANPGDLGYADYRYPNDQPATTLWFHDHALGITRANVYAGPAGFWLVRGGPYDGGTVGAGGPPATLPGPAPQPGETVLELNLPGDPVRNRVREIPIVIQDRSFDLHGRKLFYPKHRAFFEGLEPRDLKIDFAPETDVAPTWQPEAFFNVIVVNGVSWPELAVARALYRFRLLNGCGARFFNLALVIVSCPEPDLEGTEIPFFQIGAEQGFLPQVVMVSAGYATPLPGDGTIPPPAAAPDPDQALLMGLAERADVLVDFRALPDGTVVRMINTGPDEPFGGFSGSPVPGDEPVADPGTTGQVMQFIVDAALDGASPTDPGGPTPATAPEDLVPNAEPPLPPANPGGPRNVSLNEVDSSDVCVLLDPTTEEYVVPIRQVDCDKLALISGKYEVVPFGPAAALLGQVDLNGPEPVGLPLHWTAEGVGEPRTITVPGGEVVVWVTENPALDGIEEWDVYNFTADAHPIHLHLVRFEVLARTVFDPDSAPPGLDVVQPWEAGFKDTVIAYPGQVTRVKARFDVAGLYVWHCHILEHEDNEMMRPYFVGD